VRPPADLFGVRSANGSLVADRELVTAPGAAPRQHGPAILGFHALAEPMGLGALTIIRLKCAFRHVLESGQAEAHPYLVSMFSITNG